ncbi:MAG: MBL fold metallo-hydrolase [Acidobacteria bacterium]|nr:MBL fold metallo-hydrolase [Acidobacteriota bacterium]
MAKVHEIAADVYRISIYVPEIDFQFNHFLVKDDEPLLFHTGHNQTFAEITEAVRTVIDPAKIRWIAFSHFESDECGSLNRWLQAAPAAQAVCSQVGAIVNMPDYAIRPARGMQDGETFTTGKRRFRFCATAHLPHGWDAGLLFEETERTLLCSDLFTHWGDVEPVTESDIVGRFQSRAMHDQSGPLANSVPYTPLTGPILEKLAALQPRTLAAMHGSSFSGDGQRALLDLSRALRETFGGTA